MVRCDRNWNEQGIFDAANSVDPAPKKMGFVYELKPEVYFDSRYPPMPGGVPSRYETEQGAMNHWNPKASAFARTKGTHLPHVTEIRDPLGKSIVPEDQHNMYATTSSLVGTSAQVRFNH